MGAFGEASEDLHSLIHHLAISRVREEGADEDRGGGAGPDHLPFEASTLSGWREGSGSTFAGKAGGDRPWSSSSSRKEKQRPQPRENLGKPEKG